MRLTDHSQLGSEHQCDPDGEADDIIPDGIDDGSSLLVSSAPQDTTTGTLWAGVIHQHKHGWCSKDPHLPNRTPASLWSSDLNKTLP